MKMSFENQFKTKSNSRIMRVSSNFDNFVRQVKEEIAEKLNLNATIPTTIATEKITNWAKIGKQIEAYEKKMLKKQTINNKITKFLDDFTGAKKGIGDIIYVLVSVFVLAIVILGGLWISNNLNERLTPTIYNISETAGESLNASLTKASSFGDTIFLSGFILAMLGIIVTSFLFFTHPVFSVLFILLGLGSVIVSVFMSNIFSDLYSNPNFSSLITSLPITKYIIDHMPLFVLLMVAIGVIIIYSKSQSSIHNF